MSFGSLGPSEFSKSSHSSWICHQNALTEKAWEDTVQDKARALCNQAFFLSSPAFSGTETPSSVHSFFLLFDRPTHHHKRRGDGKRNIFWDGHTKGARELAESFFAEHRIGNRKPNQKSFSAHRTAFQPVCRGIPRWWRRTVFAKIFLAGKRDIRRHSTTSFSKNLVVTETSYQMLEIFM